MEKEFYTVQEFAVVFRISERSIRNAIKQGRVRAFRVIDSKRSPYRIPKSEFFRVQTIGMIEQNPKLSGHILD